MTWTKVLLNGMGSIDPLLRNRLLAIHFKMESVKNNSQMAIIWEKSLKFAN